MSLDPLRERFGPALLAAAIRVVLDLWKDEQAGKSPPVVTPLMEREIPASGRRPGRARTLSVNAVVGRVVLHTLLLPARVDVALRPIIRCCVNEAIRFRGQGF